MATKALLLHILKNCKEKKGTVLAVPFRYLIDSGCIAFVDEFMLNIFCDS